MIAITRFYCYIVRVDVLTEEKDKSTTYVELIIQLTIIQLHRTANSTQRYDTTQLQYLFKYDTYTRNLIGHINNKIMIFIK